MKKLSFLIYLSFILLLFFVSFLSGCKDNPVTGQPSSTVNVQGKVVTATGTGCANKNIELYCDIRKFYGKTGSDGTFSFGDVSKPYSLNVVADNQTLYCYNDINTINPQLEIETLIQTSPYNSTITVVIPLLPQNNKAKAIFYDDNGVFCNECDFYSSPGSKVINLSWSGNTSLSGKTALFIYKTDSTNNKTFTKYGEKPISITNGTSARVVFNDIDIGTIPQMINFSGTINLQQGFHFNNWTITLNRNHFGNIYSSGALFNTLTLPTSNTFNISTFSTPGNLYSYYLNFSGGYTDGPYISKTFELFSGNYIYITPGQTPELLSPSNNQENVDYNTSFKISSTQPKGIYSVQFNFLKNGSFKNMYMFTNSESFNFPFAADTNFKLPLNTEVNWSVAKFTGLNNLDEYISNSVFSNPKIKEELQTGIKKFKTIKNYQ